jgi:hypothetical protein
VRVDSGDGNRGDGGVVWTGCLATTLSCSTLFYSALHYTTRYTSPHLTSPLHPLRPPSRLTQRLTTDLQHPISPLWAIPPCAGKTATWGEPCAEAGFLVGGAGLGRRQGRRSATGLGDWLAGGRDNQVGRWVGIRWLCKMQGRRGRQVSALGLGLDWWEGRGCSWPWCM